MVLEKSTRGKAATTGFTLALIVSLVAVSYLDASYKSGALKDVARVVCIDSLHSENLDFYYEALEIFGGEAYTFAFLGEETAVEYQRRNPTGNDLIIRDHKTVNNKTAWMFTGEEYRPDRYVPG